MPRGAGSSRLGSDSWVSRRRGARVASRLELMPELIRFDAYMDEVLYGASGFYERGGHPGTRDGDFATSVELGSLFARCVAIYLDRTWHELGRPDPFVVVEGGAGRGTLCREVFGHAGQCREALRYVMVERVEHQRDEALATIEGRDGSGGGPESRVVAAADLPVGPFVGVVLANELLDNLPFRLLEQSTTGWHEIYVTQAAPGATAGAADAPDFAPHVAPGVAAGVAAGRVAGADPVGVEGVRRAPIYGIEVPQEAPTDAASMADALVPDAEPGTRVPLQLKAAVWVRRALALLERGRVLVFDYGVLSTAGLASRPQTDWLRTYRSQRRGHDPLREPGTADVTCEVAFDQLPPGATLSTQADWLSDAGIDTLTAGARTTWDRSRAAPTAEALAARALLDEASALTDPDRFGAFWVAEWRIG